MEYGSFCLQGCQRQTRIETVSYKSPYIYSTDLYHRHGDPDDHFDIATIYALPEIELKGIVLDNCIYGGGNEKAEIQYVENGEAIQVM